MVNKLFVRILIVKILNVLFVFACFSSLVCADELSAQQKKSILDFKESLSQPCYYGHQAAAARDNYALSDEEKNTALKICNCIADKTVEKIGGENYILNNDIVVVMDRATTIMEDINQIMPIVKECTPKNQNSASQ